MQGKLLQDIISDKVHLGREAATGYRAVRCLVCNDHSDRAGFKFDGNEVWYNCFNCGAKFFYEEGTGSFTKTAARILDTFGIGSRELTELKGQAFFKKASEPQTITIQSLKPEVSLFTPEISLPPNSYPLGAEHNEELQIPLIEYLDKRRLDPIKLGAMFSTDKKFLGRVIFPCMRNGKVIFWQARTILNEHPRYMSPSVPKNAVLWGYDNIWKNPNFPLFVTEGITDAVIVDGVALLGAKLNDSKIKILSGSKRRKIFVIDRNKVGGELGQIALANKWEITFVDSRATDINDSAQKFGELFTVWSLMKNATVPSALVDNTGISVQSKLNLAMELALAKLGNRK